jgi:expansin
VGCFPSEGEPLPSAALGEFRDGLITYYVEADGRGNCGFDATPKDLDVAALVKSEWDGSAVCGACAEVEGPLGTVRVRIVDSCPDCETPGHLDLSPSAFDKVARRGDGRVMVRWRFVSCPVSGPIRYRTKEGSSRWWSAIQVRNHHVPIRKLEWLEHGAWVEVRRQDYNYFVEPSGMGTGPQKVRVTSWDGQVLEDILPNINERQTFDGHAQFSPLP